MKSNKSTLKVLGISLTICFLMSACATSEANQEESRHPSSDGGSEQKSSTLGEKKIEALERFRDRKSRN